MIAELGQRLMKWEMLDTWIALVGAVAAMACSLPGVWLVLRRQSLLGDALSHAVLPGIVVGTLVAGWWSEPPANTAPLGDAATSQGKLWNEAASLTRRQTATLVGAAVSGVLAVLCTEFLQRWGRMERSAALGVVFTTMFALGLLMIRLWADHIDVDPGCVLYGNLETTPLDVLAGTPIPRAVVVNGIMLLINGLLVAWCFKELLLTTFDPDLATSQGLRANGISLVLMVMTAATVVTAFRSVGAILVISMLIVPAATARLLTDRLGRMILIALMVAGGGAFLGHAAAITVPGPVCARLGFKNVEVASSAGMMAVMTGVLFAVAVLASPRHGLIRLLADRIRLQVRIASEDLLGTLYRREELAGTPSGRRTDGITRGHQTEQRFAEQEHRELRPHDWTSWFARRRLIRKGLIQTTASVDHLTDAGKRLAGDLIRSHRLWEAYMAKHFDLPDSHLHSAAEQVEHYLGPDLQAELAAELNQPATDPHGKSIPPEQPPPADHGPAVSKP